MLNLFQITNNFEKNRKQSNYYKKKAQKLEKNKW